MSIADDLATLARVGGNNIYYTRQGIGQAIYVAIDAYTWINEDEEDNEEPEALIDEEVFEQTQALMRRGASRSRSPEEQPSGSNDAVKAHRLQECMQACASSFVRAQQWRNETKSPSSFRTCAKCTKAPSTRQSTTCTGATSDQTRSSNTGSEWPPRGLLSVLPCCNRSPWRPRRRYRLQLPHRAST